VALPAIGREKVVSLPTFRPLSLSANFFKGPLSRALVAAALAAGLLTGCGDSAQQAAAVHDRGSRRVASGNILKQPVPEQASNARLVDQNGRSLTLASLRGKIVVVAPLLTFCQETCPMTSANVHRAAEDVRRAGLENEVVFLEPTVDPARDTVSRIRAYERLYGPLPDWRLATGKPAAVLAMWKALGVSTEKTKPEDSVRDWSTGKVVHHSYDVHHQDVVVVIDPAGRLRWITIGHPDARGQRLPVSLHSFLNDEGRDNLAHPGARGASSWTAEQVEQAVRYVHSLSAGQ
jgi:cytochrome oxidase Cu insertion factor (SCO1/SenC/PrrC family)